MHFAGEVVEVRHDIAHFSPGLVVYGTCRGAFAEYATADPNKVAPKADGLTFEEAAVVPHGGFVALQAVRDHAKVQPGQAVLIIGAAGAVGSQATQIAKAVGAEVTGVGSSASIETIRALGADHVIDYTAGTVIDPHRRYDAILDTGGSTPVNQLRQALTPDGTLLIIGGEGGGRWIGLGRQAKAMLLSLTVSQHIGTSSQRRAPPTCWR